MTKEQVKEALDRVLTWPPERQQDAIEILRSIEQRDASDLRLTDEQLAEVRRRRAKSDPNRISLEEVFRRYRASSR